jgi:hypothetical protein
VPDAQLVEVVSPGLDVGVVVDGEADRVEAFAAFGRVRVDPECDQGVAELSRGE